MPRLTVPTEEEQAIGIWGQRHLDYLKQYRKITYTNLLTSGKLNAYFADINEQAQERSHKFIEDMKQAQDKGTATNRKHIRVGRENSKVIICPQIQTFTHNPQ